MNRPVMDVDRLRAAIRRMKRDQLLDLLDRAVELVPKARLGELVEGHFSEECLLAGKSKKQSLLEEARAFHAASMRGDYYEDFSVNSKNFMDRSEGTECFMADFIRIIGRCAKADDKVPDYELREAFELLLEILRHIDEGEEDVVFFADEGGSWQVSVDWCKTLPAYFRCLVASAEPEEFAGFVLGAIRDFADYDRAKLLTEARRCASEEQKAALNKLAANKKKRT